MKFRAIKLSLIIILIFLAQVLIPSFTNLFVLNSSAWTQPWRFITSIFLHANIVHLLYNLLALALFGSILEKFIGGKRFLLIFFVSGILANLLSINFYSSSLGASGAIFGIIGALIVIRPLLTVWAFGMPMPLFVAGILWAAGDLIGAYGFLTGQPIDNTGNIAHLTGMAFGIILGAIFRSPNKKQKNTKIKINEHFIQNWENNYMTRPNSK
ncbi:MAG: rhomboid family intramembrane serine protease [Nanoarchaeota archaeon]|nr:rhomboid family intramembrane serine protease [Nanoarchaeota archaeon]MBU1103101.1 rhomboid family intramembrane serine protease [Nanoarchaeota archaeon]